MPNPPEKVFKAGGVQLAVFVNKGKDYDTQSLVFSRSYQDHEKNWKNTSSMRFVDLPMMQLCIQQALSWKYLKDDKPDF